MNDFVIDKGKEGHFPYINILEGKLHGKNNDTSGYGMEIYNKCGLFTLVRDI